MSSPVSLLGLLHTMQSSLDSAATSLPAPDTTLPPANGISLLDIKNEVFLSYLQNLAYLFLVKLRNCGGCTSQQSPGGDGSTKRDFGDEAVKKLAELRVYLERGVRPLEGRLKYQTDKVLRAADTASRSHSANGASKQSTREKRNVRSASKDGASVSASDLDAENHTGSASSDSDGSVASIDELSYRPNPAAFARPPQSQKAASENIKEPTNNGVYRPPRITPTALPTTDSDRRDSSKRSKPLRSEAVDDYIANELSNNPTAEPSIGSTIVAGGRRNKSAKERQIEEERTAYEESNLTRLPREGKKERRKKGVRDTHGGFGGEELRGLGEGAERITKATAKRGRSGGGGRVTEDGPRGDGFAAGTSLRKRRNLGR